MHVGDMQDYTHEAEALFARIAERRGLRFEIDQKAPVEVLWRFPKQEQLSVPIVLALQNNDELNFGVADFWSYLFPFPQVADRFEKLVEAWISGDARIITRLWGRSLQLRVESGWQSEYEAGQLWPILKRPEPLYNQPS